MPFALSKDTQKMVYIDEVQRGKKCNCSCLSCGLDLVANQGNDRDYYFSHVEKNTTEIECEFSFKRGVIWMAEEVLQTSTAITLPAYNIELTDPKNLEIVTKLCVTEEVNGHLFYLKYKPILHSNDTCTFFLSINNLNIALSVTFADPRDFNNSNSPYLYNNIEFAHVLIDIRESSNIFGIRGISFRQLITDILLNNTANKKWLYHPLADHVIQSFYNQEHERLAAIEALKAKQAERLHNKHNKNVYTVKQRYERKELILEFEVILKSRYKVKRCSGCHFPQKNEIKKCNFCGCLMFESKPFILLNQNDQYMYAGESLKAFNEEDRNHLMLILKK